MSKYEMSGRGQYYIIDGYGRISYSGIEPTGNWRVYGVARRWNGKPELWKDVKKRLDRGEKVVGYFYDIDHGTVRMWAGNYLGKLPKVKIYRIKK